MDVDDLRSATSAVAAMLRHADADQWDDPTPCPDWSVRQVVGHLVVGNERFRSRLAGDGPGPGLAPADGTPEELVDALQRSTDDLARVFEQPGALQLVIDLPIGALPGQAALDLRCVEAFVHGWDLAQALGTTPDFAADIVQEAIAFSGPSLSRLPADRSPFGPPQPVDDDAPPLDRLAALLGRRVG